MDNKETMPSLSAELSLAETTEGIVTPEMEQELNDGKGEE